MVYNWSLEEHQIHTFQSNVYHLLLLIGHFLKTLSLYCEYLICIFELFMYHRRIIYKILDFSMTIFHHELDYTFMNIFELRHLLNVQTYYPSQQYQKNIINYRILQILHHTYMLLMVDMMLLILKLSIFLP